MTPGEGEESHYRVICFQEYVLTCLPIVIYFPFINRTRYFPSFQNCNFVVPRDMTFSFILLSQLYNFLFFIQLFQSCPRISLFHFRTRLIFQETAVKELKNFHFSIHRSIVFETLLTSVFSKSDGFPRAAQWTQKWDNANCLFSFHYEILCDGYFRSISMDIRDHYLDCFLHINSFYCLHYAHCVF